MTNKQTAVSGDITAPFYRAVGQAACRWQHIEAAMFVLCHALLNTDYRYSSTVFFHIKSADAKAQLIDSLCRVHFQEPANKGEWSPLLKQIKDAIRSRNKIAHYEANYLLNVDWLDPSNPPIALTPHHLDANSQENPNTTAIETKDLNCLAEDWLRLSRQILGFVIAHFDIAQLQKTSFSRV